MAIGMQAPLWRAHVYSWTSTSVKHPGGQRRDDWLLLGLMEQRLPRRQGLSMERSDGEGSSGWGSRVSKAQRHSQAEPSGKQKVTLCLQQKWEWRTEQMWPGKKKLWMSCLGFCTSPKSDGNWESSGDFKQGESWSAWCCRNTALTVEWRIASWEEVGLGVKISQGLCSLSHLPT